VGNKLGGEEAPMVVSLDRGDITGGDVEGDKNVDISTSDGRHNPLVCRRDEDFKEPVLPVEEACEDCSESQFSPTDEGAVSQVALTASIVLKASF